MTLGDSFSDSSDPGNLKDQLATLGYTYYRSSHKANMQSLFSALEKERWLPSTQQQVQSPGQGNALTYRFSEACIWIIEDSDKMLVRVLDCSKRIKVHRENLQMGFCPLAKYMSWRREQQAHLGLSIGQACQILGPMWWCRRHPQRHSEKRRN